MKSAILMAAGKGTRMHSDLPKVMHQVCGKPMISHIIDQCRKASVERIVTVVGYGHEIIEDAMSTECEFALQMPQMGTGHAVMQAKQLQDEKGLTLVVNGDCPCIQSETLEQLFKECETADMVVLSAVVEDARSYGRIVRKEDGTIDRIVEFKDCSEEEKTIREINTGIYCFNNEKLFKHLKDIENNNAQNEYYITDLVEIFNRNGLIVKAAIAANNDEVAGVNDCYELSLADKWMRARINEKWMRAGVTFINPDVTYVGSDVSFGRDVTLYPNVTLTGKTYIGDGTVVMPNSWLENAVIGKNCTIDASRIIDSELKDEIKVGPFAHIRMHSLVESKNRIGNFVEFKNNHMGYDSRCAHLTYLGDCEIGSKVNIGCGVVTVNYDGKNKWRTTVKDGAFIGSNANLIAPVTVGENSFVACGSTITDSVEDTDMAIARARQVNKQGYGKAYLDKVRGKK